MSETTVVVRAAEELAETETSPELDLMEIEKRAKKLMGKMQGFGVQLQDLQRVVEMLAVEHQAPKQI
ncbi:hypothetical protein LTR12_017913 [Friedmanniomyces endolithicus]|nr:hypothetical protein LTR12_017913 [Friedmanniomyces endolithicus]